MRCTPVALALCVAFAVLGRADAKACADGTCPSDGAYPDTVDHLTSGSPCPPPPNGICLSIPYTARVESGGDDLPSVPAAKCEGSFIQSSACRAGKIASGISSIGNLFASKAKEGRVTNTTPKSYPKATVQRIKEEYKDHASNTFLLNAITFEETSDLEFDHSLAMLCRVRDGPGTCGAVYHTQALYNISHAEMRKAAQEADALFEAHESAKSNCDGFNDRVQEMEKAARQGNKVCREREIEADSDPLVLQLKQVRDSLLDAKNENGGKCDRADAAAAAAALRGEAVSRENAKQKTGKVVGIERRIVTDDDTDNSKNTKRRKKSKDEESVVLENGYVVPETYFSECAEAIQKLDAMIDLLSPRQKVVESVCAEYSPEEVRQMATEAKAACANEPSAKRAYSRALENARVTRENLEALYKKLLQEESDARVKTGNIDQLLAQISAAGGNRGAITAVAESKKRK